MKKIVVVLKLARLSIPQKIEKGRLIVTSMTGNASFAAPNPLPSPPLTTITVDVNALETAHLASKSGGEDETAIMYAKEEQLDKDLTTLAFYVQTIANNNPANAEAIVLSAGMDVKKQVIHTAKAFSVANTDMKGEIQLATKHLKRGAFHWQMSIDIANEANWDTIGITLQAKLIKNGLTSGKLYYFRVAEITKDGQGAWSNVLSIIVL